MGRLAWFGAPAFLAAMGLAPITALGLGVFTLLGITAAGSYVYGKKVGGR